MSVFKDIVLEKMFIYLKIFGRLRIAVAANKKDDKHKGGEKEEKHSRSWYKDEGQ